MCDAAVIKCYGSRSSCVAFFCFVVRTLQGNVCGDVDKHVAAHSLVAEIEKGTDIVLLTTYVTAPLVWGIIVAPGRKIGKCLCLGMRRRMAYISWSC